ncbi:hypothetical protein B5807_07604 [Epicoccum nigrum]|uniref:Secreted protein n=1 Tax=Epicoccum nigrum TaxID=105696 RepID=A0A1Y2LXG5_EPING|nr:hypothetical protein B5807_07604 [Epicoccum nigrum]
MRFTPLMGVLRFCQGLAGWATFAGGGECDFPVDDNGLRSRGRHQPGAGQLDPGCCCWLVDIDVLTQDSLPGSSNCYLFICTPPAHRYNKILAIVHSIATTTPTRHT